MVHLGGWQADPSHQKQEHKEPVSIVSGVPEAELASLRLVLLRATESEMWAFILVRMLEPVVVVESSGPTPTVETVGRTCSSWGRPLK